MLRICSNRRILDLRLSEFWQYRELIYFLIWRDIKVRYKQTVIGILWVVLQPLVMIFIFTIFFGKLAKVPSEGVPYPLFICAALIPWQLFTRAITESANSLITNQRLITRVYFPRIIVPIATILASIIDFVIGIGLFLVFMFIYGVTPSARVIWLPLFMLLMLITSMGVGAWLSALNMEYRDVMYMIPFINQVWFFLTPILYSSNIVPQKWGFLYWLNPMTGVVEGFRWSLLGISKVHEWLFFTASFVALFLFASGFIWFRHREKTFVDVIGSGVR